MTPWEITLFEKFLQEQEDYIMGNIGKSTQVTEAIGLVFKILRKELHYKLIDADKEVANELSHL